METYTLDPSFLPGFIGSNIFYIDEDVKISERRVMTFFDAFSKAGGLLGSMTALSTIIISNFEYLSY